MIGILYPKVLHTLCPKLMFSEWPRLISSRREETNGTSTREGMRDDMWRRWIRKQREDVKAKHMEDERKPGSMCPI